LRAERSNLVVDNAPGWAEIAASPFGLLAMTNAIRHLSLRRDAAVDDEAGAGHEGGIGPTTFT
jgi:hypothetical protein